MNSKISFQCLFANLYLLSMYRNKPTPSIPVSIEELTSCKAEQIFHGNVVVTYKATLDKWQKSNEILRAYLIDAKGEMTITLNFYVDLIKQHQAKLLLGKGICITNFKITSKTNYDHGEVEGIFLVDQHTIIDIIALVN